MLHTKFHGNLPTGSGEKDFGGFLPYMGVAAIFVIRQTFVPPTHLGSTQNLA